ncbi:MAG TPA: hypothetical protein VKD90_25685 [Gemmataceae bacterium]|nr:hypothetical protein [Gemmataceae bacterium]
MSMQLLSHLRRAGWFELSCPYPDRGSLGDVAWYKGIVQIGAGAFGAIVAANAEGLRVAIGSGASALFVPWSEVSVSARRGWLDTVVRLGTKAAPSVPLVLHLDDAEADAVLRPAGVVLPARRWPRGPALWVAGAIGLLVVLLIATLLMGPR